jgi:hypothetical protein
MSISFFYQLERARPTVAASQERRWLLQGSLAGELRPLKIALRLKAAMQWCLFWRVELLAGNRILVNVN